MGGDAGEDERMWEGMLERMKERVCVCVGGRGGGMWERVKEVGGMQE